MKIQNVDGQFNQKNACCILEKCVNKDGGVNVWLQLQWDICMQSLSESLYNNCQVSNSRQMKETRTLPQEQTLMLIYDFHIYMHHTSIPLADTHTHRDIHIQIHKYIDR